MSTPGQFAKRVGVSVKTIQKCDRLGILPAKRTITNRRYETDEELAAALRLPRQQKPERHYRLLPGVQSSAKTRRAEPTRSAEEVLQAASHRGG